MAGASKDALGAAVAAQSGPDTSLETVHQTEPIRAWRGINVSANPWTIWMGACNTAYGLFEPTEARATCHAYNLRRYTYSFGGGLLDSASRPHTAPGEGCSCGFYGVKDKRDAYGIFVAEADFYGRVIEHEFGYRAEYQRILSVRVQWSSVCQGGFLCDKKPEFVVFPPDMETVVHSSSSSYTTKEPARPLTACADHASRFERVATPGQLAARLGVEVRWDDAS